MQEVSSSVMCLHKCPWWLGHFLCFPLFMHEHSKRILLRWYPPPEHRKWGTQGTQYINNRVKKMQNEGKYCKLQFSTSISHCNLIYLQQPLVHTQTLGLGNFPLKSHLASFPETPLTPDGSMRVAAHSPVLSIFSIGDYLSITARCFMMQHV